MNVVGCDYRVGLHVQRFPPWRWSGSSGIGFDSQSVVHGNPELSLASEIALRRVDGDASEQGLDLIEFATREVAKTGRGTPQVVRANLSILARAAAARTTSHSTFGDVPSAPHAPGLVDRSEDPAARDVSRRRPSVHDLLHRTIPSETRLESHQADNTRRLLRPPEGFSAARRREFKRPAACAAGHAIQTAQLEKIHTCAEETGPHSGCGDVIHRNVEG